MQVMIYRFRQLAGYAIGATQVFDGRGDDAIQPAEMCQQCAAARRADARNILQTRAATRLGPLGTMPGDGKAMCFIANFLDQVKSGSVGREMQRLFPTMNE